MRLTPFLLLAVALTFGGSACALEETPAEKKPGLFNRMLHPFRKSTPPAERSTKNRGSWRQLELTMMLEPTPLKVPETRQLKVTLTLVNKGKRFVQLEFPSTQRIEVVIKTLNGKMVEQWSEDHAFTNDPGLVSINPGERLVYTAMVATRDLKAGETYSVEGFFPNYEGLRVQKSLNPQK